MFGPVLGACWALVRFSLPGGLRPDLWDGARGISCSALPRAGRWSSWHWCSGCCGLPAVPLWLRVTVWRSPPYHPALSLLATFSFMMSFSFLRYLIYLFVKAPTFCDLWMPYLSPIAADINDVFLDSLSCWFPLHSFGWFQTSALKGHFTTLPILDRRSRQG